MKLGDRWTALVIAVICSVTCGVNAVEPEYFPLKQGDYWIYKGEVQWETGNRVRTETIQWKSEVLETAQRGHIFGALLRGFPSDLAWYDKTTKREKYLILRVGSDHYHLFFGNLAETNWAKLLAGTNLVGIVSEENLFLETPLKAGRVYGEFAETTREDRFYCWNVEDESDFGGNQIKGVAGHSNRKLFTVGFRTLPDAQVYEFVPGIGIVGYSYVHHGTVASANVKLVETGGEEREKASTLHQLPEKH